MSETTLPPIQTASRLLVGRKIQEVRYMTEKEADDMGWCDRPVVILLDDGTMLWPSKDDEGNAAGVIFSNLADLELIPTA
jgi:hypothetical protein